MPASGLEPLPAWGPPPHSTPFSRPTAPVPRCAHHARALAVADLRVEPGQRSEHPAQAGYAHAAHVGEAGIAGHGAEQVLLNLLAARPQEPVRHRSRRTASAPLTPRPPGRRPGAPVWGNLRLASLPGMGIPQALGQSHPPPFRIRAQLVCSRCHVLHGGASEHKITDSRASNHSCGMRISGMKPGNLYLKSPGEGLPWWSSG